MSTSVTVFSRIAEVLFTQLSSNPMGGIVLAEWKTFLDKFTSHGYTFLTVDSNKGMTGHQIALLGVSTFFTIIQ